MHACTRLGRGDGYGCCRGRSAPTRPYAYMCDTQNPNPSQNASTLPHTHTNSALNTAASLVSTHSAVFISCVCVRRESGPGAGVAGCKLPSPSSKQLGMLVALCVLATDFLWQEVRQVGVGWALHACWRCSRLRRARGVPHGHCRNVLCPQQRVRPLCGSRRRRKAVSARQLPQARGTHVRGACGRRWLSMQQCMWHVAYRGRSLHVAGLLCRCATLAW